MKVKLVAYTSDAKNLLIFTKLYKIYPIIRNNKYINIIIL